MLARCPWYVAGPLLGLLIVAFRLVANKPFGALGGFVDIADNAHQPSKIGFRSFVLVGLVLGGAAFALVTGAITPTLTYAGLSRANPLESNALLVGAGLAIGFGARTAGGCTSGHGLTGVSIASPASMAATMTFFAVAVGVAHLLAGVVP